MREKPALLHCGHVRTSLATGTEYICTESALPGDDSYVRKDLVIDHIMAISEIDFRGDERCAKAIRQATQTLIDLLKV